MREIKFRAWEPGGKEMMYFDLTDLDSGTILVGDMCHSVDDCKLMQFTGMVDREGKEIYQGDIVGTDRKPLIVAWAKAYSGFQWCEVDKSGVPDEFYGGVGGYSEDGIHTNA